MENNYCSMSKSVIDDNNHNVSRKFVTYENCDYMFPTKTINYQSFLAKHKIPAQNPKSTATVKAKASTECSNSIDLDDIHSRSRFLPVLPQTTETIVQISNMQNSSTQTLHDPDNESIVKLLNKIIKINLKTQKSQQFLMTLMSLILILFLGILIGLPWS